MPMQDSNIDEDQAFVLGLDTQPTEESVLHHAAFAVAGLPERIGVRLITGEGRETILKTLYGWAERQTRPDLAGQTELSEQCERALDLGERHHR